MFAFKRSIFFLAPAVLAACGGGGDSAPANPNPPPAGPPPLQVVAFNPADASDGILRTVVPTITFSHPLDAATVTSSSVQLRLPSGPQTFAYAVNGSMVNVAPATRLQPGATYTVLAGTALRGLGGEALAAEASASFVVAGRRWRGTADTVQATNGVALCAQTAIDGEGNAVAVWLQNEGTRLDLWSSRYSWRRGWTAAQKIETTDSGSAGDALNCPSVAMDAQGNGVVAWSQFDGTRWNLWANRLDPVSGAWGTAELIEHEELAASAGARRPHAAMGPRGSAWVAWDQVNASGVPSIRLNVHVQGAGWGAVPQIVSTGTGAAQAAQVGVDGDGNVIVAWFQRASNGRWDVWARRRAADGLWNAPAVIESDDVDSSGARAPRLAVAANGDAVAVWSHFDGVRENVRANRYAAGAGWGTSVLLESLDETARDGQPSVAIDRRGQAIAVWAQVLPGGAMSLQSARWVPGTGWTAAQTMVSDTTGKRFLDAQVALDEAGIAHAVWTQSFAGAFTIHTARQAGVAAWSPPQRIDAAIDPNDSALPQVAANASGDVITVWYQKSGGTFQVYANRHE